MKKKIFVLIKKEGHRFNVSTLLQVEAQNSNKNFEDLFYLSLRDELNGNIPIDYDAYFLHVSDVQREDVEKLRENNLHAWVYGFTNPGIKTQRAYGLFDKAYEGGIDEFDLTQILAQIKKPRRNLK